jgi:hypothetical protein
MKTRRSLLVIGCAGAIVAGIGCGDDGQGSEQSAKDAAQAYANARNQEDAAALCALYIAEIREQTEPRQSCEAFVRKRISMVKNVRVAVFRVDNQGDAATAVFVTDANGTSSLPFTIPLQRQDGGWALAGVDVSTGL